MELERLDALQDRKFRSDYSVAKLAERFKSENNSCQINLFYEESLQPIVKFKGLK